MTKPTYDKHAHRFETDLGYITVRGMGGGDIEITVNDENTVTVIIGAELASAVACALMALLRPIE